MKEFSLLLLTTALSLSLSAQQKSEVKSEVAAVTVYLSGAEVVRKASVTLSAGNNNVAFVGVPANLAEQTINVSANEKLLIQSVQFKLNYMRPDQMNAETRKWTDSLEVVNDTLSKISGRKEELTREQAMLDENRKVIGTNGLNFETMKQYHDYYVQKNSEIQSAIRGETKKEITLNEIKSRLTQQLSDFQNKLSEPAGEIWVEVSTDRPVTAKFEITYLVGTAGWTPEYDIRADKVNSPVSLTYKAAIWQTTGEDWKQIQLKLSTANPTAGAAGPLFSTWFMDYYYGTYQSDSQGYFKTSGVFSGVKEKSQGFYKSGPDKKNETYSSYTTVTQSTLNAEFAIQIPSNIPSDQNVHRVNIGDYSLDATYDYYSIPRLDEDVFLNAHVSDWEKLNLLEGIANVFFQGAYVGQTLIRANQTNDTLEISLGRDKNVILKREKLRDFTKEKFIGPKYRQSVTYEIRVKNTESSPISIDIIEQVPVSANAEIKITLDDAGEGSYTEETGRLLWKQSVAPNEEKVVHFSISVEFPASKRMYSPKF